MSEQQTEQTEVTKVDDKKVVYLAADHSGVREELRAAITAGDVRASEDTVDVKVAGVGGEKKTVSGGYIRYEALTLAGALLIVGGQLELADDKTSVLSRFNYAEDLAARGTVRTALLKKAEGPEKAIERGIKGLMAAGFSEAKAIKTVLAGLIEEGELPADYVYTK
jgi:hypothetical protein